MTLFFLVFTARHLGGNVLNIGCSGRSSRGSGGSRNGLILLVEDGFELLDTVRGHNPPGITSQTATKTLLTKSKLNLITRVKNPKAMAILV